MSASVSGRGRRVKGCNRKFRKVDNDVIRFRKAVDDRKTLGLRAYFGVSAISVSSVANFLMILSKINIYPIKSCRGISLAEAIVEARGLQFDRRWMLVDENNRFLTQREYPVMATIATRIENGKLEAESDGLSLEIATNPVTTVPASDTRSRVERVTVWQSEVSAAVYGDEVNDFFSDVLGAKVRLVYMRDGEHRHINPRFDRGDDIVSFADGYPLMLLSEASVEELNSRLEKPLPMNRFRPNLVVSGAEAFAEDDWKVIRVGEAVFRSTKPCERCVITTTDQARGEVDGKEPLKTLATYRQAKMVMPDRLEAFGVPGNAVLFGQNLVNETAGVTIRVGDAVEVLEKYEA